MGAGDRKDILYILLTVSLFIVIGVYLAFTQGQSLSNVVLIPFRTNSATPTPTEAIEVIEGSEDYFAKVETNLGVFVIDLLESNAPNSVESFVYLSESGYYDNTSFHRFIPDFLLQGGSRNSLTPDKSDDKYGNPGYVIDDEINWESLEVDDNKKKILEGEGYTSKQGIQSIKIDKYVVAWANSSPNTNGSQFFIVLGDSNDQKTMDLEGRHTVFGKIVEGQALFDEISKMQVNLDNLEEPRPSKDIVIKTITIEKR